MHQETLENLGSSPATETQAYCVDDEGPGPNTRDKAERFMAATGHQLEDAMATYHPAGVVGKAAGKVIQHAVPHHCRRCGDTLASSAELHHRNLSSVFITVGVADTSSVLPVVTFESQRSADDGPTVYPSHALRHGDVRIRHRSNFAP